MREMEFILTGTGTASLGGPAQKQAVLTDNGTGDYENPETGLQQAVCSHVMDLGDQDTPFGKKRKIAMCFELAQKMRDGRPFMQSKIYTSSLNEKSTLRKDLESWRGKRFAEEELKGFDVERLIGVGCMLNLIETAKDNKIYVNIATISKLPLGYSSISPVGQPVPEWIRKMAEKGTGIVDMSDPIAFDDIQNQEALPF
jgi:hypothetical protein